MNAKIIFSLVSSLAIASVMAGPEAISPKESKEVVQPVEKECTWTGFYIGAHAGYSFGDDLSFQEQVEDEGSLNGPEAQDPPFHFNQEGFLYGGQIGVNLQLNHWLVLGVEGALSGTDISDTETIHNDFNGNETNRAHFSSDWLFDFKLRGGISFMHNHLLAYGTGGFAYSRFHYDNHQVDTMSPERWSGEEGRIGGLAGGGLEYAINCHWSVRLEYDHYIFDSDKVIGTETHFGDKPGKKTWFSDIGDRDAVEAGVNFKF